MKNIKDIQNQKILQKNLVAFGNLPDKIFANSELKALPVFYNTNPNRKMARVKDVLVDKSQGKVLGLVLESERVWRGDKFVALADILALAKNGVWLRDCRVLKKIGLKRQKFCSEPWFGMPIYNEAQKDFGTMADFIWTFPSGNLVAIAVSGGIWQDVSLGWQYLPWQEIKSEDVVTNQLFIRGDVNLQNQFR